MTCEEIFQRLAARPTGLQSDEAAARLARYGPNELQAAPGPGISALLLKQLDNPLIYMLLAAIAISALSRHYVDAGVILLVVLLNTIIGALQEWRAEEALAALRKLAAPHATVLRNGIADVIAASQLMPGDILLLEAGDQVAADARVCESSELTVDESSLTGESRPVVKQPEVLPARLALVDRTDMVWMTTAVTNGRARAIVVATGMQTVMGEIAQEVRNTQRTVTPLQRQMAQVGNRLGYIAIGLAAVIFILGILRGYSLLEMLLFAVAAAVSSIPEGLPAVISVVLALGVQRMATRHAIVRRLPAVETLGSTSTICTDKTGTITRNEMTVTRIWAGGMCYTVTGEGFAPEGEIVPEAPSRAELSPDTATALKALLLTGSLDNNASVENSEHGWVIRGDPTEGALRVAAQKGGISAEALHEEYCRVDEIPFSSKLRYMATLHRHPTGVGLLCVKGAPERIIDFCTHILAEGKLVPLTVERRREILRMNEAFAVQALRVLAGAFRELTTVPEELEHADVEHGMVFAGLWGLLDPPRAEAVQAIHAAQQAGIRISMITGDHAVTATAIARQVGIILHGGETVTGEELDEISDDELRTRVKHIAVFARVSPLHKLRIVNALRATGEVVAMTGDGVNDAPALKQADIGVAMGITGTEVAKEAADMVLTDDNFATIVNAVEEGRVIFSNLRKVVFFLVTTNMGEIITITGTLLLGLPLPLTAVMILWVNLVTDGLCTAPLGVEPKHDDVLQQPPRPTRAGIIDRVMLRRIVLLAPLMAVGTIALFWYELRVTDFAHAQTVAFTTMVAFQWFHALNARSQRSSLFTIGIFTNRWLFAGILCAVLLQLTVVYWTPAQMAFHTVPLDGTDWLYIVLVSGTIFLVDEVLKLFGIHQERQRAHLQYA